MLTEFILDTLTRICGENQLFCLLQKWSKRYDHWRMTEKEQRMRIILNQLQRMKSELRMQYANDIKEEIELQVMPSQSAFLESVIRDEVFLVLLAQRAAFLNDSLSSCCTSVHYPAAEKYVLKGKVLRDFSPEKMEVIINDHRQNTPIRSLVGDILLLANDLGLVQPQ